VGKKSIVSDPRSPASPVDSFMSTLDHPHKFAIQELRTLILSIDPRIKEEIKWNAPSFFIDEHFATFKLHPPKTVQLVLHTGAKVKPQASAFQVDDPEHLLAWPAKDRAVLTLESNVHAARVRPAVRAILRQWIAQLWLGAPKCSADMSSQAPSS
jgi:hypothetical protein